MKLGNIFKKFEGIDTTILLVSLSIIIVIIVLAVKNSKIEDFENEEISNNTELYSRGPAGDAGPDGEPKPNKNINNIYPILKKHVIDKLVEKNIIVNFGSNEEPNYFPLGTINMKTVFDSNILGISSLNNKTQKYFNINYTKKVKDSYVKIKYTISVSGHNNQGNQFRLFSSDNGIEKQISATHSMAGVWDGEWQKRVPKSINITGIDTSDKLDRNYYIYIDNFQGPGGWNNNKGEITVNGQRNKTISKYNAEGYFKSSCTIEEVVLPKDTDTTLSKFVNPNQ